MNEPSSLNVELNQLGFVYSVSLKRHEKFY